MYMCIYILYMYMCIYILYIYYIYIIYILYIYYIYIIYIYIIYIYITMNIKQHLINSHDLNHQVSQWKTPRRSPREVLTVLPAFTERRHLGHLNQVVSLHRVDGTSAFHLEATGVKSPWGVWMFCWLHEDRTVHECSWMLIMEYVNYIMLYNC